MKWILLIIGLVLLMGTASATPNVTAWSNNYSSDTDTMFLVNTNDVINFNVTVNETVNHTWYVNKVDQYNNYDDFTFTVPYYNNATNAASCIWEIHLNVSNTNGSDHHEWVISTLNNSDAPDIFDYFTDGKYNSRTETDPWGRALPEWSLVLGTPHVEDMILTSVVSGDNKYTKLKITSDINNGTWQWRIRYKTGSAALHASNSFGHIYCMDVTSTFGSQGYKLGTINDGHVWFDVIEGSTRKYALLNNITSSWGITIKPDMDWHTPTVIRKIDDSFTIYHDGEVVSGNASGGSNQDKPFGEKFQDFPDSYYTTSSYFSVYFGTLSSGGEIIHPEIDCIAVWNTTESVPTIFEDTILTKTDDKTNILIDHGHGDNSISFTSLYTEFCDMLEDNNCVIKTIRFTRVNDTILNNFDIYMTTPHLVYDSTSQAAMKSFVNDSNGRIFMMGGSDYLGAASNANSWLGSYGMDFKAEGGSDIATNITTHDLTTGVTSIRGLGYTYIDISGSAENIIAANAGTDKIALAVYENATSRARVISFGDEWPFKDTGSTGITNTTFDHRTLAENVADWLTECAWSYNSSYTYTDIKYRYFTNGSREIIGRNPLETDKIVFADNSSWPVV